MKPVIHLTNLILKSWKQGEHYEGSNASFGKDIGLKNLGIRYNEVPAAKTNCPFHNHHNVDELFYILEGKGSYRFGADEYPVEAGDVLSAPAGGQETAHQIINTGTETLRYLSMSANAPTDLVEYPDSGKFQYMSTKSDEKPFRFIGRMDSQTDYWDGEPGA